MAEDLVPCVPKFLPPALAPVAATTAVNINPANAVNPQAAGLEGLDPGRLALLVGQYWGSDGVKLDVYFMDTGDATLQAKILSYANLWSKYANIRFMQSNDPTARVRVARTPGQGYYSYIGTDILHIPTSQPTLNLDRFTLKTPESEYNRVVPHEFGHTAGFPHEHSRAEVIALLDRQKVYAYFEATQGWSQRDIDAQILTPLRPGSFRATNAPDTSSVMCYSFPGALTLSGQPIPGGAGIDATDGAFAALMYPLPAPPPPPPPPPGTLTLILPQTLAAGTYTLTRQG